MALVGDFVITRNTGDWGRKGCRRVVKWNIQWQTSNHHQPDDHFTSTNTWKWTQGGNQDSIKIDYQSLTTTLLLSILPSQVIWTSTMTCVTRIWGTVISMTSRRQRTMRNRAYPGNRKAITDRPSPTGTVRRNREGK